MVCISSMKSITCGFFVELVENGFDALFELAPVLRASHNGSHVERYHALVEECARHFALVYAQCETFHNSRFAYARLADEHGVVLLAAAQKSVRGALFRCRVRLRGRGVLRLLRESCRCRICRAWSVASALTPEFGTFRRNCYRRFFRRRSLSGGSAVASMVGVMPPSLSMLRPESLMARLRSTSPFIPRATKGRTSGRLPASLLWNNAGSRWRTSTRSFFQIAGFEDGQFYYQCHDAVVYTESLRVRVRRKEARSSSEIISLSLFSPTTRCISVEDSVLSCRVPTAGAPGIIIFVGCVVCTGFSGVR